MFSSPKLMKKITLLGLHASYWFLYGFLVSFLFVVMQVGEEIASADWEDWTAVSLFTFLTGISSFYAFYSWLAPRYLTSRQVKRFIGTGMMICLVIALLSTLLVSLLTTLIIFLALHQMQWILFSSGDQLILFTGFTLMALINGVTGTLLRGFITWYNDIHLKERVANQSLRTELAWIKSQLNPHFLFNTLHNIDILIEHDPPRASRYLNKLSELLRFSLYETQADQIPLSLELASIEKYIELQKIRTTNQQYVTMQIQGNTDGLLIAPMLFMPYLENAFKFATNKKTLEAIRIQIAVAGKQIHFRCTNVIDQSEVVAKDYGGLGQELLGQRLALLYPQNHNLVIEATDTIYSVDLTLSLKAYALSAC
jgi:two-component system LytT family sensor kinase